MDGMDGITTVQICSVALLTNFLSLFGKIGTEYQIFGLIIFTVLFLSTSSINHLQKFLGDVGSKLWISCGFIIVSNYLQDEIIIPFYY